MIRAGELDPQGGCTRLHRGCDTQRRSLLPPRGCLLELRGRAGAHFPRTSTSRGKGQQSTSTGQHHRPHVVGGCLFGAALTTLADNALSPVSFHHSGLGVSLFA